MTSSAAQFVRQHGFRTTDSAADVEVRTAERRRRCHVAGPAGCHYACKAITSGGSVWWRIYPTTRWYWVCLGSPLRIRAWTSVARTATIKHNDRIFVLHATQPTDSPASISLLTAKQLNKQLKQQKVSEVFLVLLVALEPRGCQGARRNP